MNYQYAMAKIRHFTRDIQEMDINLPTPQWQPHNSKRATRAIFPGGSIYLYGKNHPPSKQHKSCHAWVVRKEDKLEEGQVSHRIRYALNLVLGGYRTLQVGRTEIKVHLKVDSSATTLDGYVHTRWEERNHVGVYWHIDSKTNPEATSMMVSFLARDLPLGHLLDYLTDHVNGLFDEAIHQSTFTDYPDGSPTLPKQVELQLLDEPGSCYQVGEYTLTYSVALGRWSLDLNGTNLYFLPLQFNKAWKVLHGEKP